VSTNPASTYSRSILGGGMLGAGVLALIGYRFHPGTGFLLPIGLLLTIPGVTIMLSGIIDGFKRGR